MFNHVTVLKTELIDALNLSVGDVAFDCTAGGGGHTEGLLKAVGPTGRIYAFDRDPKALGHLKDKFKQELSSGRLILVPQAFSSVKDFAKEIDIFGKIDGICADIGVSSPQLDEADRGFSFSKDGPLDMRMDTGQALDAAHVINTYDENTLSDIFFKYGEEPKSRFIARAIVSRRQDKPFSSTTDLAETISGAIHYKTKSKKHPATKAFQALRIFVNSELDELETLCSDGFECIRAGGRLSIITFHSLEDKCVKRVFKTLAQGKDLPAHLKHAPLTADAVGRLKDIKAKIVKPFPLVPTDQEIADNPRSRSSKLRTIEKLET